MVRHGLKHIFQKPTPDIDSSDRTQQLRSKTIYAGTVNLAQTLVKGNNNKYKTYNGPYEVVTDAGNSNLIASRSYDDLLSITKGKVLLNQLPLNSASQDYYQQNFAKGQMYEGNYNQFDPQFNFIGHTGCNNSVLVYDISNNGFTGPVSYDASGGYIGVTGPGPTGISASNKHIFIDPNHCYYSDPCLLDASYTRFVDPVLSGLTGSGPFTAQQIISADQYRGFSYPMPNFNLTCSQPVSDQSIGPIFCPKPPTYITTTVYDWRTIANGQSRTFTINRAPLYKIGYNITIVYSNTDSITGIITAIVGNNITITITAFTRDTYVVSSLITTTPLDNIAGSTINPILILNPVTTTPTPPEIVANTFITDGVCYLYSVSGDPVPHPVVINILGTAIQRPNSNPVNIQLYQFPPVTPTLFTFPSGCFVGTMQIPLIQAFTNGISIDFGFPIGGSFNPPNFAGTINGYTLPYAPLGVINPVQ
jgi:hypothetical protein